MSPKSFAERQERSGKSCLIAANLLESYFQSGIISSTLGKSATFTVQLLTVFASLNLVIVLPFWQMHRRRLLTISCYSNQKPRCSPWCIFFYSPILEALSINVRHCHQSWTRAPPMWFYLLKPGYRQELTAELFECEKSTRFIAVTDMHAGGALFAVADNLVSGMIVTNSDLEILCLHFFKPQKCSLLRMLPPAKCCFRFLCKITWRASLSGSTVPALSVMFLGWLQYA